MSGRKSFVWDYFIASNGVATCNLCKKSYTYKSATSSLSHHLKTKHSNMLAHTPTASTSNTPSVDELVVPAAITVPDIPASSTSSVESTSASQPKKSYQETLIENLSRKRPYPVDSKRVRDLDQRVVKMICKDLQPFTVVEDEGMIDLVDGLDPRYNLPSRTRLTTSLLPKLYDVEKAKVGAILKEAVAVALTSDMWTSRATQGYLTVTLHLPGSSSHLFSTLCE